MKKRILACLLSVMLLSSVLPVQAAVVELSTDIADKSWVCVDEDLRIVVTFDKDIASKVSAYINGSEKAYATKSSGVFVISKDTLLPGENTVSFKAIDADGNQVGETNSITINGFKALNSTVISETDFNNVTDEYIASYDATLKLGSWQYGDFASQTETSYLSPEVLYGCDTMIFNNEETTPSSSRAKHSDNDNDLYLQVCTSSSADANLEFKLRGKDHIYPGETIKFSMDIYANESDTFRYTTSRLEDTTASGGNEERQFLAFADMSKGWYKVVAYFNPEKKVVNTYLYKADGTLVGNVIKAWTTDNGLVLNALNGSFGAYIRMKQGKTAGFDNIKFERLSTGHYDDFSVILPESLDADKLMYSDATEMTVIAYGEGAKVYVDKELLTATSTDGVTGIYNIDGAKLNYGIKHIQVDYKNDDEFETVYKDITLIQTSDGIQKPYIKDLFKFSTPQTDIKYHILSGDDMTNGIRVNVSAQFPSGDDFAATIYEINKDGQKNDVSKNFKAADWKKSGVSYAIAPKSENQFKPNCFYKVIIDGHSIYFYTPGDSGAYLNLYDAQLKSGEFCVRAEKAASASFDNAAKLIVAVYNSDELVGIKVKDDLTINEGVSADGVSVKYTGNATNAKAFILDGLDSIKPLITNIEVK